MPRKHQHPHHRNIAPTDARPQFKRPARNEKPEEERTEADGVHLPYPDSQFTGKIETRMQNSTPDFPDQVVAPEGAPNILLVMTDDVGFGAANTFGGPAETPNMTRIGKEGLTYNRFHTTSVCSATRAAILTGRHPHNVATGYVVDSAAGYPGYCSQIPKSCACVAQVLRMNGYSTGWFGKNHNVPIWQTSSSGPYDQWPTGLGFERFYGFNGGEANQYHPLLYDDTVPIQPSQGKTGYHLDDDLANQCIQFIKERHTITPSKPFFVYYVPGATHAPHHVPDEWTKKYKNKFGMGWDKLREQTLENQKKLGIAPENTKLMPRPDEIPSWDSIKSEDDRELYCRMMEVYCGFLEMTDNNIGRILDYVDEIGETDNTLVIYIQGDNGGSAEGSLAGTTNELSAMVNAVKEPKDFLLDAQSELGSELHFNHMPIAWAWALNSPMQWAKKYASHFGGTRNGMVIRWPEKIKGCEVGTLRSQFHHVIDIMPTCLDAAGIPQPVLSVNGTTQTKMDGVSMLYTFDSKNESVEKRPEMIFELSGNRGLYKDGWMLSSTPIDFAWLPPNPSLDKFKEEDTVWELYNVNDDFAQAHNYMDPKNNPSDKIVKKKDEMYKRFMQLAEENHMLPICFTGKERLTGAPGRPSVTSGYGKFEYPNGIIRIPEPCAPDCKNVSFTIDAYINVPVGLGRGGLEGTIVSMGGKFCGYGIIVLDGYPVWVYNLAHWPEAIFKITGTEKLTKGHHVITVNHDYEGGDSLAGPGTFSMYVDGKEVGSVHAYQTVKAFFSLSESFDIGQDTGSPLVDDYLDLMPFKFNGEIQKVVFEIDDSNLSEETKYELEKAKSDYLAATD